MRYEDAHVGMKCITDYGYYSGDGYGCHSWRNGHIVIVKYVCMDKYIQYDCLTCGDEGYKHSAEYLRPLPYDDDCEIVGELGDVLI